MIYLKILIITYVFFIAFCFICYIAKKFLEVVYNAHKKRIKNIKQYRNRK